MKKSLLLALLILLSGHSMKAQYAADDHWYDNPLGFEPLNLHTAMGFIVPAAVAGTLLLLTDRPEDMPKITLYNEGGPAWGYKYPHTFIMQDNTGVNVELRKFLSLGAEFSIYLPSDRHNSTIGFSVRPFARFYAINRDAFSLYFESGGGMVYFAGQFPKANPKDERTGTYWNGVTKYGLGSEIRLNTHLSLMLGIRHLHISNGNSKGVERNPSHDSNGFFFGLAYSPDEN